MSVTSPKVSLPVDCANVAVLCPEFDRDIYPVGGVGCAGGRWRGDDGAVTRIVAGLAKGRRLAVPQGPTRPTSDRTREALFSTIESLTDLPGARFLDLYAGSGAVGLEALSRGAAEAILVDSDPKAVAAMRLNISELGLPGAQLVRDRVERLPARLPGKPFDVIFADPPYAVPAAELAGLLTSLNDAGWFAHDALIIVERNSADAPWSWPERFVTVRHRSYGAGTLWYGRRS